MLGEGVERYGGVAEGVGAGGAVGGELLAEGGVVDPEVEGAGDGGVVVGGAESATVWGDDFGGTSGVGGDDGFAGVEGFDVGEAEGLWAGVGLAVDIGGGDEFADIGLPAEEKDAVGDVEFGGALADAVLVFDLMGALGGADEPADPVFGSQLGECLDVVKVAFVGFPAADLDDDGGAVVGFEFAARGGEVGGGVGVLRR